MSEPLRTDDACEKCGIAMDTPPSAHELIHQLYEELAKARGVISDGANSSLDAAIRLADMSVQDIKLMAGEMTAGELRAVRAVVKGIVARITALREATK